MSTKRIQFELQKLNTLKSKYLRKVAKNSQRSAITRLTDESIDRIKAKLNSIDSKIASIANSLLKLSGATSIAIAALLFSSQSQAQIFNSEPDTNFTLSGLDGLTQIKPNFVDMDGDGDLDLFVGGTDDNRPNPAESWYFYGVFKYFENTADPNKPAIYGEPVVNPWGLDSVMWQMLPTVADLDTDGDLDILASDGDKYFLYYENTAGQGNEPSFISSVQNPFGLTDLSTGFTWYCNPAVSDFDGDGDMDVLSGEAYGDFIYFENTAGKGNTPAFAPLVKNPFGLTKENGTTTPTLNDIDGDGDLDLISFHRTAEYDNTFAYYENTALSPNVAPVYGPAQVTPFGLPDDINSIIGWPSIADLDNDGDFDFFYGQSRDGIKAHYNREIVLSTNFAKSLETDIYPNPAKAGSQLFLDIPENHMQLTLKNSLGTTVFSTETTQGKTSVSLPILDNGLYIIELTNTSSTLISELVIAE